MADFASENVILSDDVVCVKDGDRSRLALVVRSTRDESESEDSEYSEEDEKLEEGKIEVSWYPSGKEQVVLESKMMVVDRSMLPNDTVRRHRYDGQKGYVTNVHMFAAISILGTNLVIKDVDCRKYLSPLQELSVDKGVVLGPWVGVITEVFRRATLWLKNGLRCSLNEEQLSMLHDIDDKRDEDSPFFNDEFFPSQSVVGPAKAFKDAKWLSKVKPILKSQVKAVIEESKVVEVCVNWRVCGPCPSGCAKPSETISGDKLDQLKTFTYYKHTEVQIGDKGYYVVKEGDIVMQNGQHVENKSHTMFAENNVDASGSKKRQHQEREQEKLQKNNSCGEVLVDKTTLNNGFSAERQVNNDETVNITSNNHLTSDTSDDGDVESDGDDPPRCNKPSKQEQSCKHSKRRRKKTSRQRQKQQCTAKIKAGDRVCVEVVKTKSWVDVMWQDGTKEEHVDTLDLVSSSQYEEHQLFPGNYVADRREHKYHPKYGVIQFVRTTDRTCQVLWFDDTGKKLNIEKDVSVYDVEHHLQLNYFHPGEVVGVLVSQHAHAVENGDHAAENGEQAVTSHPQHHFAGQVVEVDNEGQVVVAWVGENMEQSRHKPQDLYEIHSEDEGEDEEDEDEDEEWETASEVDENEQEEDVVDNMNVEDNLIIGSPGQMDDPGSPPVENVDLEALNNANNITAAAQHIEQCNKVDRFLMLSEVPEDHEYRERGSTFAPNNPQRFMSVLRKEMLLLQSSLPDGILIRGYENAMQLCSVLIYGPEDTPYEDSVFLFDISLPEDYPESPPLVHYHSYSVDSLNPNLYVTGDVCLSLLGTWDGKEQEMWTPKSNILQLLLSIQGLILCKEPYFNEAGYEKYHGTVDGTENSRVYNETAILHLTTAMEQQIKKTHSVFENEIKGHFKKNREKIINRLQGWLSQRDNTEAQPLPEGNIATHCELDNTSGATAVDKDPNVPHYPLYPLSRGFLICLQRNFNKLKQVLDKL